MKAITRTITTSICICKCYDPESSTLYEAIRMLDGDVSKYAKESVLRMLYRSYPDQYVDITSIEVCTKTYTMPIETFIEHAQYKTMKIKSDESAE